ncbi:energy-coupling factor transporter transmembrane component T [Gemella cuniculi]|uniref:energy-coupling factor transporter transmembrane component T n=1 Tax=Gemella cuniculi TaxID=150240 RepID=UPI000428A30F|nr:energy-coupling factor transporter transmembrane component T [Gemella cuniculi]
MDLHATKNEDKKKIKFHPLVILLINVTLPFINTIFPSNKAIFFTLIFSLILLALVGCYKRLLKSLIYLLIFFTLYELVLLYTESVVFLSVFRMMMLFLPCIVLASLLVFEYNSSEILSALQLLKLPKIFIIGLTVALRYISTFGKEFRLIKESMYIRGVKVSIKHPLRSFEYLLVPQLYRCLNLSSELTCAGLTKGIDAPHKRTSFYSQKFSFADYMIILFLILGYGLIIGGVL